MLRGFLRAVGVYRLYEKWLTEQVLSTALPSHVGIILDGNRRWGINNDLSSIAAHKLGASTGEKFLEWCLDLGIKTVTVYAFSTENFKRPKEEVAQILSILEEQTEKLLGDRKIRDYKVHVKAIGRTDLLPISLQSALHKIEAATSNYNRHYLNVAVAYGGRAEILDATRKIAEVVSAGEVDSEAITEEFFNQFLYTAHLPNPYPDMIIRTSGEERLSGFLLWQAAYSEFCFMDVYWPAFRKIDFLRAIRTYQNRKRRFGE